MNQTSVGLAANSQRMRFYLAFWAKIAQNATGSATLHRFPDILAQANARDMGYGFGLLICFVKADRCNCQRAAAYDQPESSKTPPIGNMQKPLRKY